MFIFFCKYITKYTFVVVYFCKKNLKLGYVKIQYLKSFYLFFEYFLYVFNRSKLVGVCLAIFRS